MIDIIKLADKTIPKSPQLYHLRKKEYETNDIMELISAAHKQAKKQTAEFAKEFPGRNLDEKSKLLFDFLLVNIRYKEDAPGFQFVKLPSAVWHDKFCDCKSFSLFIGGILANWKVPFAYRFTSYSPGEKIPRHVYPVIKKANRDYIIMDVVYKIYNKQKNLINKPIDLNMEPGLYYVAGIGSDNVRIDLQGRDISEISDAEMDLLLAKDRMDTMREITEKKRGVTGTLKSEQYQDSSDMIQEAIEAIRKHQTSGIGDVETELGLIADQAVSGDFSLAHIITGLGAATKKQTRQAKKAKRVEARATATASGKKGFSKLVNRTQKALKKVAVGAKKGVKAVLKVYTLPERLAVKAVLEVLLPKASTFFLYLFISDKTVLDKLPEPIRQKRAKEERVANFIIDVIGMKQKHFMAICRNGIMKQTGKSPESLLSDMFGGIHVSGIGQMAAAAAAAFAILKKSAPTILELLSHIHLKFGKKHKEDVTDKDNPGAEDFAGADATNLKSMATDIKAQDANQELINNPDLPVSKDGGGFWNTLK